MTEAEIRLDVSTDENINPSRPERPAAVSIEAPVTMHIKDVAKWITFSDGRVAYVDISVQMRMHDGAESTLTATYGSVDAAKETLFRCVGSNVSSNMGKLPLELAKQNIEAIEKAVAESCEHDYPDTLHGVKIEISISMEIPSP